MAGGQQQCAPCRGSLRLRGRLPAAAAYVLWLLLLELTAGRAPTAAAQCAAGSVPADAAASNARVALLRGGAPTDGGGGACFEVHVGSENTCDVVKDACCVAQAPAPGGSWALVPQLASLTLANADPTCASDPKVQQLLNWTAYTATKPAPRRRKVKYLGQNITVPVGPKAGTNLGMHYYVCVNFTTGIPEGCNNIRKLCGGSECQVSLQLSKVRKAVTTPGGAASSRPVACCLGSFVDLDACDPEAKGGCHSNAVCARVGGGEEGGPRGRCVCGPGYEGDGKAECTDINECASGNGGCDANAKCINTPGGRECVCKDGFTGVEVGSRLVCKDRRVAAMCSGLCDERATCLGNGTGPAVCRCLPGFTGDGATCTDVDECSTGVAWRCRGGSFCVNTEGGYDCACSPGLYPARSQGGVTVCVATSECGGSTCPPEGRCVARAGAAGGAAAAQCACPEGFNLLQAKDGSNLSVCAVSAPRRCRGGVTGITCHPRGLCRRFGDDSRCVCEDGFEGDGVNNCTAVDLCRDVRCAVNADCWAVTANATTCQCREGYKGDGYTQCTDVDECAAGNGGCNTNAACANTEGGRTCTCKDGYTGDGVTTCTEINDCTTGSAKCHPEAYCNWTMSGAACSCRPGYAGDGKTSCQDVDECAQAPPACHPSASCINSPGGYSCSCGGGLAAAGCSVLCWGDGQYDQTSVPSDLGPTVALSSINDHTCAVVASGALRCFGRNGDNQTAPPPPLLEPPGSGGGALAAAAGMFHTCYLTWSGAVGCFGDASFNATLVPEVLRRDGAAAAVAAGGGHSCALTTRGAVMCWGNNEDGQASVPDDLQQEGAATAISAGPQTTCAVTAAGTVRCFGFSKWGAVDPLQGLSNVTAVSAGHFHTCALRGGAAGAGAAAVVCWGHCDMGECELPPEQLPEGESVTSVAAGMFYTLAVTSSGRLLAWGAVSPPDLPGAPPANVTDLKVSAAVAGASHACVIAAAPPSL